MKKWSKLLIGALVVSSLFAAGCSKKSGDSSEENSSPLVNSSEIVESSNDITSEEVSSEEESSSEDASSSEEESSSVEVSSEEESSSEEEVSSEEEHVHALMKQEAQPASCTVDGVIEHWTCDGCEDYFADENGETTLSAEDLVIAASHTLSYVEATAPSGKTNGNIEYWACSVCEGYFADEVGAVEYTDKNDVIIVAALNIPDFLVEVEEGRDPVVLQISDTQTWSWGATPEEQCYKYVREVVGKTNPDLIIVTGDLVYGRYDPKGELLTSLITFMETLDTPWAPVFGNHDNESLMGVDWQCQQLEAAENCLFKQGDVTGNGNYSVGIEQGGELLRVFYMMDSNGCGKPMCDEDGVQTTPAAGTNVVQTSAGFGQDQIDWYTNQINAIHEADADVKISFAYHIQQAIFMKAFEKYEEYDATLVSGSSSELANPLNLDTLETAEETDFGYLGRTTKGPWDTSYAVFNGMKALGVDSIFVGHEHCNSVSIVYEGVRFQYSQKSSTYDRYNWALKDGTIAGGYTMPSGAHPIIGGTVIPVSSEDGSIGTGYISYYGDPFYFEPEPEPVPVEGLQYGTDLTAQSDTSAASGSVQAVTYGDTNAYYIVSGSSYNRMYINVDLLRGKDIVTFDILVPEEATTSEGAATQEFAIRVKPNQTEETMPGVTSGYLWFDASYTDERKIVIGEWQTITIDISGFADVCTEFGIYFVEGNNGAYIKNVAVSEKIEVNGLALDASMLQSGKTMTLEALAFDETTNAYKLTSGSDSAKIYFDTALAVQYDVFTFSVYIPEDSPITDSTEFMLRVKPDNTLTEEQGSDGKYIYYSSTSTNVLKKVTRGAWTTISVDISGVGEDCTEFSFMFMTGAVVWFKDIAFTEAPGAEEPEEPETPEEIVVGGLQYGGVADESDLWTWTDSSDTDRGAITAEVYTNADGSTVNAYKVTSTETSQNKLFINPALLKGKSTVTLSVLVTEKAYTSDGGSTAEYMLRVKPTQTEETLPGISGNYVNYDTNYTGDQQVVLGEWKTITIDITPFADECTEFSILIAAGSNTVWFKDITVS